jgi:hypothetical protein
VHHSAVAAKVAYFSSSPVFFTTNSAAHHTRLAFSFIISRLRVFALHNTGLGDTTVGVRYRSGVLLAGLFSQHPYDGMAHLYRP